MIRGSFIKKSAFIVIAAAIVVNGGYLLKFPGNAASAEDAQTNSRRKPAASEENIAGAPNASRRKPADAAAEDAQVKPRRRRAASDDGRSAPETPEGRETPPDREFTIISVGDIMMHDAQIKAGYRPETGDYDFSFMFEKVAPILREGDLVIGNLETPLAGEENGGYSGYPQFNAPGVLAKNLKDAGFSLVGFANNHTMDRRYDGIVATLDNLDSYGLMHTGAFRTQEERDNILTLEIGGVRIAAIAATFGTNGIPLPKGREYSVYVIDEAEILADIAGARRGGAQFVIVMLHWGSEYAPKPDKRQTTMAMNLLRGGADLILGNHPHVPQIWEVFSPADLYAAAESGETAAPLVLGPDKEQKRAVIYSQGNFVSNQNELERYSGLLLKLIIGVDGATGEPFLKDAGYIPVYTQRFSVNNEYRHTVWPTELAIYELDNGGSKFRPADRQDIRKSWNYVSENQPALKLIRLNETPVWNTLIGAGEAANG